MNKYIIQAGIGGGFNDVDNYRVIESLDIDAASIEAYYWACEIYDNYLGSGGLRDVSEIMEDEDCDEDEAIEIFNDDRESWIDYSAEEYTKEKADLYEENYHLNYDNESLRS